EAITFPKPSSQDRVVRRCWLIRSQRTVPANGARKFAGGGDRRADLDPWRRRVPRLADRVASLRTWSRRRDRRQLRSPSVRPRDWRREPRSYRAAAYANAGLA